MGSQAFRGFLAVTDFLWAESDCRLVPWRADRVAEGDGLENRCVSNGAKGSNPLPSAAGLTFFACAWVSGLFSSVSCPYAGAHRTQQR